MKDIKQTYSKEVIEIADYSFANPKAKRKDILAKFGKVWQTPTRTLDRLWKDAKEYNKIRINKQEKAKDEVMANEAKNTAKELSRTRSEYEAWLNRKINRLDEIIAGKVYRDINRETGKVVGFRQDTSTDEIAAIRTAAAVGKQLSELMGWDAPMKVAETDAGGKTIDRSKHEIVFINFDE